MLIRLIMKPIWACLGSLSFLSGLVGLILPVVPQIPFFIAAIFCFAKLSPRFHQWLITRPLYQRYLTPLVQRFRPHRRQRLPLHND